MASYLRKYAVTLTGGTAIAIPMIKAGVADFAVSADWTPATGDVKVSIDDGTQNNIGTLPAFTNGAWVFVLTGTELTGKRIRVIVIDSATKAVEDNFFDVETYGNASALHAFDLGTALASQTVGTATAVTAISAGGIAAAAFAAGAIDASAIATDAIGSAELAASAATEIAAAVQTVALTEAYASDGAAPTQAQLLFMIAAKLGVFKRDVSSTTETSYKVDKSTPAMTHTLDSATSPTSETRAS